MNKLESSVNERKKWKEKKDDMIKIKGNQNQSEIAMGK